MSDILSSTIPGKPSASQASLLAHAVRIAYEAGWKGSPREKTRPRLPRWAPKPTRISLRSKGLLEFGAGEREELDLTKHGVAAGEAAFRELHSASAKDRADLVITKRQEEVQARQGRKDHIIHLFRGLYLHRESGYRKKGRKKYKAVAAHLENSSSIQMNEEDLLALGEGIEKLRENQSK